MAHTHWMEQALTIAQGAGEVGEIPVGAIIVNDQDQLISIGENRKERDCDPLAHAEIQAIQRATKVLKRRYLQDCRLYVTLEPCPMCAGAIILARLGMLIFGTPDPKTGAVGSVIDIPKSPCALHSIVVIGGVMQLECQTQLQTWFRSLRQQKAQK